MIIALDGFGGDHAPLAPLQGAAMAVQELGVEVMITGNEETLRTLAKEQNISLDGITIVHTEDVIDVCEEPTSLLREHKESSMAVAMRLVRDGKADAFVSAGSTGAVVVGGTLIVKRIKGVKRPTLGALIPCRGGSGNFLLVDSGANAECKPEMLKQFATMGSIYMERVMGVKQPRVGLVNIGTEDSKGTALQVETNRLLKEMDLNYIGNVEPRGIPTGSCDVVVADGFSGNILLKTVEGMAKFMSASLKDVFSGVVGKLAGALVLGKIKALKATMDYTEHGGAPLIGTAKPVIKAHGSSNAKAIKNAIRQAKRFSEQHVIELIAEAIAEEKEAISQ